MSTFSNGRILPSAVLPSIGFYDSASPERYDEQARRTMKLAVA